MTTVPFALEQYINKYKLVHVRIYLTSKPELEEETWSDIDDDILFKPGPVSELQGISKLPDTDQNNEYIIYLFYLQTLKITIRYRLLLSVRLRTMAH